MCRPRLLAAGDSCCQKVLQRFSGSIQGGGTFHKLRSTTLLYTVHCTLFHYHFHLTFCQIFPPSFPTQYFQPKIFKKNCPLTVSTQLFHPIFYPICHPIFQTYFYHGPDISRAMVTWPPCRGVTDSLTISLNRQGQTCPIPAEGQAPP